MALQSSGALQEADLSVCLWLSSPVYLDAARESVQTKTLDNYIELQECRCNKFGLYS